MSIIYLIRHGFTPANNASYNGQKGLWTIANESAMPLDIEYGRKQALELANYLESIKGNTLILVSPYNRAKETMEICLPSLRCNYKIMVRDELREISSGFHYAKTKEELVLEHPEAKDVLNNIKIDPLNTRYLNGESQIDVRNRTKDVAMEIKNISDSGEYDNILIFGHGTTNHWLCYWLTGIDLNRPFRNCEIFKITDKECTSVFEPKTVVPKGYLVDIDNHKKLIKKINQDSTKR